MNRFSSTTSNSPSFPAAAFGAASVMGLAIGHDLLHMPLQVSDSLSLMADAALSPSAWNAFYSQLAGSGYFRPLFYAEVKWLFDLGNHAFTYRLFHAALAFAFVILFVRALEVRDRYALICLP